MPTKKSEPYEEKKEDGSRYVYCPECGGVGCNIPGCKECADCGYGGCICDLSYEVAIMKREVHKFNS